MFLKQDDSKPEMIMISALITLILLFSSLEATEPQFVVFTGSYNNARWVEKNIESLATQTYPNWECIYVNDASTDSTLGILQRVVQQYNIAHKVTIIDHKVRLGIVANMNAYLRALDPKKIVVILDGDDFLAHKDVLKRVAQVYRDSSVWLTYGNYKAFPEVEEHRSLCRPISKKVLKNNAFREHRFRASHLRTFYAKLFQGILEEDLQENGQFLQIAGDVATTLPMLEMASRRHIKFIDEVLYRYNAENPLSDYLRRQEQIRVENLIRSRSRYQPLKTL